MRLDVVALVEQDSERMWSSLSVGCLLVRAVSFGELSGYSLGLGVNGGSASLKEKFVGCLEVVVCPVKRILGWCSRGYSKGCSASCECLAKIWFVCCFES